MKPTWELLGIPEGQWEEVLDGMQMVEDTVRRLQGPEIDEILAAYDAELVAEGVKPAWMTPEEWVAVQVRVLAKKAAL